MNQSEKEIERFYTQADMDQMISIQRALAWRIAIYEGNNRLGEPISSNKIDKIIKETKIALKQLGV